MGKIKMSVVSSAPVDTLYQMGHDVASFTELFPSLKSIKVLEKKDEGRFCRAEWTAGAKLITQTHTMSWIQEDVWDDEAMCCNFSCAQDSPGRFKHLRGRWHFKPHRKGSEMLMEIDYAIDHPLINPMIEKIIDGIMKRNNESLMNGLRKRAERG